MDNRPIGIFDSGIGGLTILTEVRARMPGEDILYLGDTARVPYGSRSKRIVTEYTKEAVRFLLQEGVKAIIIACNTASALAMDDLESAVNGTPLFGVVKPGARGAAAHTVSGKVGVIGTEATVRSRAYQTHVRRLKKGAEVIGIGCPLFVPIIEEGWQNSQVAMLTAQTYLSGFFQHNIDTLILGCTHYPAMWSTIRQVMGDTVYLINPAYETAKEVQTSLREKERLSEREEGGKVRYTVTDSPERFKRVGGFLITETIYEAEKVELLSNR
ncbi:MAG: glutamate racemase [Tissierellia bacterium]|nr:glutamate racemase [Bacillota bacterium]NLK59184.1 glutamate racemase [Tissierellia bacterium]